MKKVRMLNGVNYKKIDDSGLHVDIDGDFNCLRCSRKCDLYN